MTSATALYFGDYLPSDETVKNVNDALFRHPGLLRDGVQIRKTAVFRIVTVCQYQ